MMLLGENSRTVATRVKAKVEEISKTLPEGVVLTTVYNRSDLVNATLGTVEHNLAMGAGLVVLVLIVLLGNVRAAIITAAIIPLSLLATFLIMKPLGISGNLMSLGALDFGIIVDGAVILIDNCVRAIHEMVKAKGRKLTKEELQNVIYRASVEIRKAAGFGQLIIVVVFGPIFALTGIEVNVSADGRNIRLGCSCCLSPFVYDRTCSRRSHSFIECYGPRTKIDALDS